jgi:hypothetical protein
MLVVSCLPGVDHRTMNAISRITFIGLYALVDASACSADITFGFLSERGKWYEYQITSSQLNQSPKWEPEKDEYPPFPAGKALAKAKLFIETIDPGQGMKWKFAELSLVTPGTADTNTLLWAWRARWELIRVDALTLGPQPPMYSYILMDGTVLQPKVTDRLRRDSTTP